MKFTVTSQFDLINIKDVRIVLVEIINTIVQRDFLSQEKVAEVLKIDQSTVYRLKYLKTSYFSLERIFLFLLRLNCDVNLVINRPENTTTIKVRPNIKNVRIDIMSYITSIIAKYQLTQVEAVEVMLINQPTVSKIRNLKADRLAVEYLLNLLARINRNIEIIVKEKLKMPSKA